jgi:hypothetical protein
MATSNHTNNSGSLYENEERQFIITVHRVSCRHHNEWCILFSLRKFHLFKDIYDVSL